MSAESEQDRSRSRGRQEAFHSSGRGGAGNIRAGSRSRDARPDGPDDFSLTRGREMGVSPGLTHSGRGGAGNIRSPSREPGAGVAELDPKEIEAMRAAAEREAELPHSSGRGGAGNIFASRSRSRSRAEALRSSGRGGVGNIAVGGIDENAVDEEERRAHHHVEAENHSTGRGGSANITTSPSPHVEHAAHHLQGVISSGRGGVGNIRDTSRTRDASADAN
ncbi:hypothetical protein BU17DRAFT_94867 [Hysterangium stoloniferum]|nr:hypothetical protein BU17DRAFT_94867 [Hysterangium stoloniferum]